MPGSLVGDDVAAPQEPRVPGPREPGPREPGPREPGPRERRFLPPLAEFLREEAAGGAVLLVAALAALAWGNGPWHAGYEQVWTRSLTVGIGDASIRLTWRGWVNDGLMTVFFFVVGLEIKRELVIGELRDRRMAALPAIAALGGMIVPAAMFVAITAGHAGSRGWGIPMATDIAFVVGVLAVLGRRVPTGLRLFLLTLALVDDIGAIVVIAIFYSRGIALDWLGAALALVGLALLMRRAGAAAPVLYVPLALALWVCTHESGVPATIAGISLGLVTPATPFRGRPVLERLEHWLHPWSSFGVVPLFALANAGVFLGHGALERALGSRITWAVVVGRVLGKLVGIAVAAWCALRLGLGRLPDGVDRRHLLGGGALAGIGFTVALFVAGAAYRGGPQLAEAKAGILLAALLAGGAGSALLLLRRL